MIRVLLAGSVGLFLGGVLAELRESTSPAGWATGPAVIAIGVCSFLLASRHALDGIHRPTTPELAVARSRYGVGVARVDGIDRIAELNGDPVCDLAVTAVRPSGEAFRTVTRQVLPLVRLQQFQPGTTHAAVFLTDDGPELVVLDETVDRRHSLPDEDASSRVPLRLREAHTLVRHGRRIKPLLPTSRSGRVWRVALYLATCSGCAAATIVLVTPAATPG